MICKMLESVKPVIKSFQNIVERPVSVQAPQHPFDTITFEKYFQTTGRIKIDNYSTSIKKGMKLALIGKNGSGKVVSQHFKWNR